MRAPTSDIRSASQDLFAVPVGDWHVDPVRSHVSFTGRLRADPFGGVCP